MSYKIPDSFFKELLRREVAGEIDPDTTLNDGDVTLVDEEDKTVTDKEETLKFFE